MAAYIYDEAGKPTWFILPAGAFSRSGSWDIFEGDIYTTTGPNFGIAFDPKAVNVKAAGRAKLTFKGDYAATLTYTLNGVAVTKEVGRLRF